MKINKEKLLHLAIDESEEEIRQAADRRENRDLHKASMKIAMKIKRALRMADMNQAQLAHKMGIDPAAMSRLLNGKSNLELKTMVRFEKELGINIIDRSISLPAERAHTFVADKFYQITNIMVIHPEKDTVRPQSIPTSVFFKNPESGSYSMIDDIDPVIVNEPLEKYS